MKKTCAAAILGLSLMLMCGCRSGGEYYTKEKHIEKESVSIADDTSAITGYYTLKGAIMNMVNMAVPHDVLKIGEYSGDLEEDLQAIIQEVTTTDPIGIYGVSSINVDQARVLTYREVSVTIQYKKSHVQIRGVTTVSSQFELLDRIGIMLGGLEESAAFIVPDRAFLPEDMDRTIYELWMKNGSWALGLEGINMECYPEESDRFILELQPSYVTDPRDLALLAAETEQRAADVAALVEAEDISGKIAYINTYLLENVEYDTNAQRVVNEMGGSQRKSNTYTAYGALVEGKAAQSGFVLAASVMLDKMEIEHTVETGTVGEDIYSWITLDAEGESLIYDVTALQVGREAFFVPESTAGESYIEW